ncbi:class I SAM-dependent methyltransferase [Hahella aquimaris]|uniref:class I SAM-dependent methyltransferase n=1 Tax=Hahella sp. HNIBRBA332 TaxID=3015983 RepID=UPI00273B9700|nr:class I SAM-dependent methyltransferase [Hahella sp. HNIBRBA332]WLQ15456.1 class I SAM-dependent methyltransferase [Hahella sp. HNIBRBA332]
MNDIVQLSEDRVAYFDHDSTAVHAVSPVVNIIRALLNNPASVNLLDVGGGNGTFLDTMLSSMPESKGTIVEMSRAMADKNAPRHNKEVICDNYLDWADRKLDGDERFDVIFFNFVLHHFVGESWTASVELQNKALEISRRLLTRGGVIVVYEIHYNGGLFNEITSKIIYGVSSSKVLAPFAKLMGANTAGFGVCFHSEPFWRELFSKQGMICKKEHLIMEGAFQGVLPKIHKFFLNVKSMSYKIHFIGSE